MKNNTVDDINRQQHNYDNGHNDDNTNNNSNITGNTTPYTKIISIKIKLCGVNEWVRFRFSLQIWANECVCVWEFTICEIVAATNKIPMG